MIAMREGWAQRCRRLAGMRPPPLEPVGESVAAADLRMGDCFWWGDIHLSVLALERAGFIHATCSGLAGVTIIDLHPLEEVLVHIPRPAPQWENPDDHGSNPS